jgi:probable HAF family extracellular repeat protein
MEEYSRMIRHWKMEGRYMGRSDKWKKSFNAFHTPPVLWGGSGMFQGVGFLPDEGMSMPTGISGDGTTIVGSSGQIGFRWTAGSGMRALEPLSRVWLEENGHKGHDCSRALGVSFDGAVIVGASFECGAMESHIAVVWTNDVASPIGGVPETNEGIALSGDGRTAVIRDFGPWNIGGYVLDLEDGTSLYPDYESCFFNSPPESCWRAIPHPTAVSGDGRTVVGIDHGNGPWAFSWNEEEGMVYLHTYKEFLDHPMMTSQAYGISADGMTIVGVRNGSAFRWTRQSGFESLGERDAKALDVSGDGSVVVGEYQHEPEGVSKAFLWTEALGMTDLGTYLEQNGLEVHGWVLERAVAVSDNGLVITGWGLNPDGMKEGWVATIPSQE